MVPGAGGGIYTGGGAGDAVKKNRLRAVRERAVTGRTESSAPTGALPHPLCRAGPMCPAAQGDTDSPCLPLRGRWQREALAEGEIPHGFLSPSRLRRQPPPRGGLAARRRRADGTAYPKGICSAALHGRTPSPTILTRDGVPYARLSAAFSAGDRVRSTASIRCATRRKSSAV